MSLPAGFQGHVVDVISKDLIRVEIHDHNHDDGPFFVALIMSSDETMSFSKILAQAALKAR